MQPGAFLVNTARESLVDEDALDAALSSGHLSGAALDVFEQGEPGHRSRLLSHPNVVLTPHIGGATAETLLQGAAMIAQEIERFAADQPLAQCREPARAGMSDGLLLAIDAGTGSCRAVLFAPDGVQAGIAQREYVHQALPGVAGSQVFDTEANWRLICECVREVLASRRVAPETCER